MADATAPGEDYVTFLARKAVRAAAHPVPPAGALAAHLFPHQRDLVRWALARGRAAIFAGTGLGKTAMQLEWARHASAHGRVLILAPLAVAEQTVREGERFGVAVTYARADTGARITITNYEMLDAFDPAAFVAIVLDESSILKAYDGKTRTRIIEAFAETPWRLACTATPAPNDYTELGNHAEFLGVRTRTEMLAEYFVHDGGETQTWRLKGHAEDAFWRWVCSWAAVVTMPSDLGHDDGAFVLPPLRMHERVLGVSHADAQAAGLLFAPDVRTLADQRATRRMTRDARVADAAALLNGDDEPAVVWCELNDEADAVTRAVRGAVQIAGADPIEDKHARLVAFCEGRIRVLVTKPSIAGHGVNWQHCHREVFLGASHSFEQTFQAIRRCWRFGQTRPVDVYVLRAATESAIVENYRRKEQDAARLQRAMVAHLRLGQVGAAERELLPYSAGAPMRIPAWLMEDAA